MKIMKREKEKGQKRYFSGGFEAVEENLVSFDVCMKLRISKGIARPNLTTIHIKRLYLH